MSNALDSIRVAIRVRPLLKRENACKLQWQVDGNTIFQLNDGKRMANSAFVFDRIFDKDMATIDLYMDFGKPIVVSAMEGINGTLFAYGQTSSGKTYTMTGDEKSPGIIPHALGEIFDYISGTVNREFLLRVSYMEIYNEVITDLLKPKHTNLKIHENPQKEIFVGDLTEKLVASVEEIIELMKVGERNRHFGCTNMNEKSSRSHTIFRMVIESREIQSRNSIGEGEVDGAVKVSHLNLVDLAGSERASATGAEGIRLREGGFINKSLFALGNVINKLSEGESAFIPFRDSKLTRILQTSLGGNAKTAIICAVTPASNDETLSTLQFASRAKTIKNRPEVNEVLDETTLLKRYRREINELKKKLEQFANQEALMELQKDQMEQLYHAQIKEVEEKKQKLANFICTAQPKNAENFSKRNKRRWTVCPMGALSKPPMNLDLPSSFGDNFMKSNKRIKPNVGSYNGSDSPYSSKLPSSGDFNQNNRDRFFADIEEKEEEIDEEMSVIKNDTRKRSGSLGSKATSRPEKRSSLAENVTEERIAELEMELQRLTEERDTIRDERDAIRNDLSENITSSCEIQNDLLMTKEALKEKKQQNRELQQRVHQLESAQGIFEKHSEQKQILGLQESLSKERQMFALTEATYHDMCVAKEKIDKELAESRDSNLALSSELEAAVVAKDDVIKECQRLKELNKELEDKADLFDVIQGDLETVDALQEELSQEQEKNNLLQEELRKNNEDILKLEEKLKLKSTIHDDIEASSFITGQESIFAEMKRKLEESHQKLELLEEENSQLCLEIEKLRVNETCGVELEQLKRRVQELEKENTSSNDSSHGVELLKQVVKEKDIEVSVLKGKIKQLTDKLMKKRRRASYHSSGKIDSTPFEQNPEESCSTQISFAEKFENKMKTQEECRDLGNVTCVEGTLVDVAATGNEEDKYVSQDVGLVGVAEEKDVVEELEAKNKMLEQELVAVKGELQQACSTVVDLEEKVKVGSSVSRMECEKREADLFKQLDELRKKYDTLEEELKEASEVKSREEEELGQAVSMAEVSKQEHQKEIDVLQNKFREEQERHKNDVEERLFVISELEVKLQQAVGANSMLSVEHGIPGDESELSRCDKSLKTDSSKEIKELNEKLKIVLASKEFLEKEHEAFIVNLQENSDKALKEVNLALEEKSKELNEIKEQLKQVSSSNDSLVREHESLVLNLQEQFYAEIKERDALLEEKTRVVNELQQEHEQALSSVELGSSNQGNTECSQIQAVHAQEMDQQIAALKEKAELVHEFKLELNKEVAKNGVLMEEYGASLASQQKEFSMELERKDLELVEKSNEINVLREQLEKAQQMHFETAGKEEIPLKKDCKALQVNKVVSETAQKESEEIILQLRKERDELRQKLEEYDSILSDEQLKEFYKTAEEREQRITELEKKLSEAAKKEQMLCELEMELEAVQNEVNLWKHKNEEAEDKQKLKVELNSLKQEFQEKIERMENVLKEKTSLCATLEYERMEALTGKEDLINERDEIIAGLEREFGEERKRLDGLVEEKLNRVQELEEAIADQEKKYEESMQDNAELQGKVEESVRDNEELQRKIEALVLESREITAELSSKSSKLSNVEPELEKVIETKKALTEERDNLLSKCSSLEIALSNVRKTFSAKCEEVLILERKNSDANAAAQALNQENGNSIKKLQKENEFLKAECDRLEAQVKTLLEKNGDRNEKDKRITELRNQVEQLTKESDLESEPKVPRGNEKGRKVRRESLLFKLMLEDIKEEVSSGTETENQGRLIDELNHALVTTQEKLEQKEFVIDEKDIEIMERDAVVSDLKEKLRNAECLLVSQKTEFEELKEKSQSENDEKEMWKKTLEENKAALEAQKGSEEIISQLRKERDELRQKLEEYDSILSEEQLKEFYKTAEERDQRITELEKELTEAAKKDQKLCELEMEFEIVQNEVQLWRNKNEGAEANLQELKEIIKEQEKHVVELQASKEGAEAAQSNGELHNLRQELEAARSRLDEFETEKNRGLKLVQEKNQLLDEYQEEIELLREELDERDEELQVASKDLTKALQEVEEKKVKENEATEEIQATQTKLKETQEAHQRVSEKLESALKQLSEREQNADQSCLIEKLRKEVKIGEDAYRDMFEHQQKMEKIIDEQEAECEEYMRRIEELESMQNKASRNEFQADLRKTDEEWAAKEKEITELKERVDILMKNKEMRESEYGNLQKTVQEMEEEIDDYKKNVEGLESGKKELEDRLKNDAISSKHRQLEVTTLKAQINTFEGELKHLRSLSIVKLEDELKKVKSDLKSKELDLYHAQYETTKQIDAAKSKIRGLEKDCSNFAKKNNELKAEIRRLRNQDEEPTIDIMNNKLKSSRGEGTVGVVGSVTWFTLDAKLARLTQENEELKEKSDELEKKNQTLNIINVDLKQRHHEVIEKYKRLKEKFLKTVETGKSKPKDPASEVETKSIDQKIVEPMQESKKQDTLVAMQFNTKPKTVVAPAKEETGGGQKHKRPTASKQSKENLFEYEKPDACNTQ